MAAGGRPASRRLSRKTSTVFVVLAMLVGVCTSLLLAASPRKAQAASYQDWPMFLQNTSRTNATTDPKLSVSNASLLKEKYAFATGGPVATSVSVVGTTAYVGSWDGYEYAFNTSNGSEIWKSPSLGTTSDKGCNPVNVGITSSADLVNGVLYVGGGGPDWYALNPSTGAIEWNVDVQYGADANAGVNEYNWSSPLIYNGYAYIGMASNCDNPLVQGQLLQVSLSSHKIVNAYDLVPNGQVGGGIWTSPTLDTSTNPPTIFVTTGTLNDYTQTQSQAIVALNASTLAYEGSWQLPFEAAISDSDWGTTPTLTTDSNGDQLVTAANKNGIVYTWKRSDLELGKPDPNPPLWQHQIAIGGAGPTGGDGTIASGIFANGTLYYAGGHNVSNGHGSGGSIGAYNPGTGATEWVRQTEQPIIGAPAYVNGMIGYGEGNTFEVLNAANGQLLYSYELPAPTYGAVSVARSEFFVPDLNDDVYAFGLGPAPATPPKDPNCPKGLTCQDIGSPGVPGSESTSGGVLTVKSSGTGAAGVSDQFRFIWKPVKGNFQSSVEVLSQSPDVKQPRGEAGIIVRQSLDPASPFYGVWAFPNNLNEGNPQPDVEFKYRACWGCEMNELTKWYPAPKPVSVMVQRKGNLFSAGISFDQKNYQLVPGSTEDLDLPAGTLAGLVASSGAPKKTATAGFRNLAVGAPLTTTMAPQAPANPCPSPWTCADIGNPNPPGNTTASSSSSYTLDGTGTGIGGGGVATEMDSFHYVYQQVSGNEALSAQVVTQSGSPKTAQEGIMMRANASPTAPYYAILFNPGGSATISWRYYDGVVDGNNTLALPSVSSPYYVQIVSWTDTAMNPPQQFFSTETSSDGNTWSPVLGSTQWIPMGNTYLAGMAADAESPRVAPPVVYNSVSLASTTTQPPGICPQDFTCADLGPNILPGNQLYVNPSEPTSPSTTGTWTIQASGSDIWSTYDNFRYLYENFPDDPNNSPNGDGTVSARVVSQSPGPNSSSVDPWSKTGVMIRGQNGDDNQAPYYGVFVTPANGVVVQWRPAEAAETDQVYANPNAGNSNLPAVTPIYVLAERYTDTTSGAVYYAGFTSTDGKTWTWIPNSTVALDITGFLTSGIATDSHNDAGYTDATVDNLAQFGGASAPPGACPSGWSCNDIGGPLPPGQDNLSSTGTWSEVGGGGDIWGTSDSFHMVSQSLSGDGEVTAQVSSQQNTSAWAKAGVMLRQSTDPGSPYYAAFITPGNGVAVQWRSSQGASSNQLLASGTAPIYLRAVQYTTTGSNPATYFSAYSSTDGSTWSEVPGSTVSMSVTEPMLAGFAITSHDQGTGSAVTLNHVSVTAGEFPPPGLACPSGWSCADIGAATPQGGQSLSGGTWSITGGGGDIWGTADAFHYVWQSFSGSGSVSADVTAQTESDPSAKAGVMIRSSTDPGSPYYAVYVTPGDGIEVQTRTAQGGSATQAASVSGGTVPVYLEVTESGSTFTASTSTDGTHWTPIAGSSTTISALSGSALAGMAVCSHNTGTASTATFQSVTGT